MKIFNLKVAWVVKIKLFFMDRFNYNLIILIKWCKTPHRNLDKALLFLRNQTFFLKIWKLWRAPTILQFNIFCWNFAHVFYLPMSTKACVGFFLFYLDLELFAKIEKDLVSTHSFFTLLFITLIFNKVANLRPTQDSNAGVFLWPFWNF